MKTSLIVGLFAILLNGCSFEAGSDGPANNPDTASGEKSTVVVSPSGGDLTVAPPAPTPTIATTSAPVVPAVSPGTLVSCVAYDTVAATDGTMLGVCAATTAAGKPRYLRSFQIVTVSSPVTAADVSVMVGFE